MSTKDSKNFLDDLQDDLNAKEINNTIVVAQDTLNLNHGSLNTTTEEKPVDLVIEEEEDTYNWIRKMGVLLKQFYEDKLNTPIRLSFDKKSVEKAYEELSKLSRDNETENFYVKHILKVSIVLQEFLNSQNLIALRTDEKREMAFATLGKARRKLQNRPDIASAISKIIKEEIGLEKDDNYFSEYLLEQVFFSALVQLGEELCTEEEREKLNIEYSQNFWRVSQALGKVVLQAIIENEIYEKKNSIQKDDYKSIVKYLRGLQLIPTFMFNLGYLILEIFKEIGLVDQKIIFESENKKYVYLYISNPLGKHFFLCFSKMDRMPFEKLLLLRYPYPIERLDNQLYGKGFTEAQKDIDSAIKLKETGCRFATIGDNVLNALNSQARTPFTINFILFQKYRAIFDNQVNEVAENAEDIIHYMPKVINKETDFIRVKNFVNKMRYIYAVGLVEFGYVFAIKSHEIIENSSIIDAELKTVFEEWKALNALNDEKGLSNFLTKYFSVFSAMSADPRGRNYENTILTYYGSEFERSLVLNYRYMPLKGCFEIIANYFVTIYGYAPTSLANLDNLVPVKKASWNEKVKLFSMFYEFYSSPLRLQDKFVSKPYLLVTLYSQLKDIGFWEDKRVLESASSKVLLSGDATGSGPQILSVLGGDIAVAGQLNLKEQNNDSPIEDIYTVVTEKANIILKRGYIQIQDQLSLIKIKKGKTYCGIKTRIAPKFRNLFPVPTGHKLQTHPEYNLVEIISEIQLSRSLIKSCMMPFLYGITHSKTAFLIKEYILTELSTNKVIAPLIEADKFVKEYKLKYKKWKTKQLTKEIKNYRKENPQEKKVVFKKDYTELGYSKYFSSATKKEIQHYKLKEKNLNAAVNWITFLVRILIKKQVKKIYKLYHLLRQYAYRVSVFNVSIEWSPLESSTLIEQLYEKKYNKVYTFSKLKSRTRKRINIPVVEQGKANPRQNASSWPANFIQSIDAAIVRSIIKRLDQQFPNEHILIRTVMDCFVISPYHYDLFLNIYKEEYFKLFSEKNIQAFLKSLKTPAQVELEYVNSFKRKSAIDVDLNHAAKIKALAESYDKLILFFKKAKPGRIRIRRNLLKSKYLIYV